MGAWAQDPVPGAAAGANPGPRSNILPGTGNSTLGDRAAPAAAQGTRSCAHAPLVLEFYIIF